MDDRRGSQKVEEAIAALPKDTDTLRKFNPSNNEHVDEIKRRTDELIQYLRDNVPEGRRRSIAITEYEGAAMWAVKSVFSR